MATVTIQLLSICDGDNHAVMQLTKGGQSRQVNMDIATMRSNLDQDEVEAFCKVAIKLINEGKTRAQLKTALQTGVSITL